MHLEADFWTTTSEVQWSILELMWDGPNELDWVTISAQSSFGNAQASVWIASWKLLGAALWTLSMLLRLSSQLPGLPSKPRNMKSPPFLYLINPPWATAYSLQALVEIRKLRLAQVAVLPPA